MLLLLSFDLFLLGCFFLPRKLFLKRGGRSFQNFLDDIRRIGIEMTDKEIEAVGGFRRKPDTYSFSSLFGRRTTHSCCHINPILSYLIV